MGGVLSSEMEAKATLDDNVHFTADASAASKNTNKDHTTNTWTVVPSLGEQGVEEEEHQPPQTPPPLYRIEHAKSGRSKCRQVGSAKRCDDECLIAKGDVRIGTLNAAAGSYGKWQHLQCWRVPASIHRGKSKKNARATMRATLLNKSNISSGNSNVLSGYSELHPMSQEQVLDYIMNRKNWMTKQEEEDELKNVQLPKPSNHRMRTRSTRFFIPTPGVNGAPPENFMSGKRFVLTGTFPEVGGGIGLELGKAQVKTMIESFGGRVNVSISGLTTVLVVGQQPGFAKVRDARTRGIPMIDIWDLQKVLLGTLDFQEAAAANVPIQQFSNGYQGNGLGQKVSSKEWFAVATGQGY